MWLNLINGIRSFSALFIICVIFVPLNSQASTGFGCNSAGDLFSFGIQYFEGDGLISGDLGASFKGKKSKPGWVGWMKWDRKQLTVTNLTWTGRQLHFDASKIDAKPTSYKIRSGFIVIDGEKVDLSGLEIDCEAG